MTTKRFLLILLFTLLSFPGRVEAQEEVTLQSLNVALWPEYDRPQMLVIYNVVLSSDVPLPVEISLRIPVEAGEPNAVAERDINGRLFNVAYDREIHGDWAIIKFIVTEPVSQMEYYDPGLVKDGANRHYEYRWPGDYAVAALSIQVQQPTGARALIASPELGAGSQAEDGLVYYGATVGDFASGETFSLSLDYEKDSDALSVGSTEIQPSKPIDGGTAGRVDLLSVMPWLVTGAGLVLIVISAIWFWRGGRTATRPSAPKRSRRRAAIPELNEPVEGEGVHCHQCGKRAEPGDRFCRACGTKLRV